MFFCLISTGSFEFDRLTWFYNPKTAQNMEVVHQGYPQLIADLVKFTDKSLMENFIFVQCDLFMVAFLRFLLPNKIYTF